ncbi:MAG: MotA/TolQ/ExbB proton channel family protein [Elusimicrobia bacterium]|nr:MotA/TolQ/ExbB proton channel family protein [Elusimicrobiota bacterium]
MMYPLVIASILVVAIIIDRLIYFRRAEVDEHDLFINVKKNLKEAGPDAAIAYCERTGGPVAAIFRAGLQQYGKGREKIEDSFEREALIEVPKLKKFLPALNTIGSISTLMGFTGTVLGMIRAFNSIAQAGTTSAGIVAGGIGEALTTTAAGLVIAIPALIAYHYFSHRVESILLELEKASRNLIDVMEEPESV